MAKAYLVYQELVDEKIRDTTIGDWLSDNPLNGKVYTCYADAIMAERDFTISLTKFCAERDIHEEVYWRAYYTHDEDLNPKTIYEFSFDDTWFLDVAIRVVEII